jgi:Cu(I)/Ag(I) efflux system membrane fusion protein
MKKKYIVKLLLLLTIGLTVAACQNKNTKQDLGTPKHAERDTSLNYLLQPVNEQVIANIPLIRAQEGTSIHLADVQGRVVFDSRNQVSLASRVSGRIEKLYVKYNYQPVKKGELIMEIYSPDLAAAQRELLLIQQSGNEEGMLEPAKKKLMLLGMAPSQITKLLRTGQISYHVPVYSNATGYILEKQAAANAVSAPAPMPSSTASTGMGDMASTDAGSNLASSTAASNVSSVVLLREGQYLSAGQNIFTIYRTGDLVVEFSLTPEIASRVAKQAKVLIQRTANKQETITGKIGLIQPVFNAGENFVVARVYLHKSKLQPGELVTGKLPFLSEKGFWLPKEAVVSIGNQSVVFKKVGKVFMPTVVKTGVSQNNQVQVFDEISGWDLAKNAYYLIDSESFIKTAKRGA